MLMELPKSNKSEMVNKYVASTVEGIYHINKMCMCLKQSSYIFMQFVRYNMYNFSGQ